MHIRENNPNSIDEMIVFQLTIKNQKLYLEVRVDGNQKTNGILGLIWKK